MSIGTTRVVQPITWQGPWDSGTAYVENDAVSYLGSSWLALVPNTNVTPIEGATWTVIAEGGSAVPLASSTVPGKVKTDVDDADPVVYLADSVDDLLDTKVEIGGQIGGTITSPEILGVRETSGPTLLTLDDVADGEYLKRDGSTIVSGVPSGTGGSGTVAAQFPLDVVPTSPHAKDDEFPGTSLSGIWTNPAVTANGLTLSVANGWLSFEPDTAGTGSLSGRFFGIRQAAPAGSFSIMAKVASFPSQAGVTESYDGVFVGVSGGKGHVFGIGRGTAQASLANMGATTYGEGASDWSAFDSYNNTDQNQGRGFLTAWYRIEWVVGTGALSFFFSFNGFKWEGWLSRTGQSQPTSIGLGMYAQGNSFRADKAMAAKWFRVTEP
jgi:hypothetical protein